LSLNRLKRMKGAASHQRGEARARFVRCVVTARESKPRGLPLLSSFLIQLVSKQALSRNVGRIGYSTRRRQPVVNRSTNRRIAKHAQEEISSKEWRAQRLLPLRKSSSSEEVPAPGRGKKQKRVTAAALALRLTEFLLRLRTTEGDSRRRRHLPQALSSTRCTGRRRQARTVQDRCSRDRICGALRGPVRDREGLRGRTEARRRTRPRPTEAAGGEPDLRRKVNLPVHHRTWDTWTITEDRRRRIFPRPIIQRAGTAIEAAAPLLPDHRGEGQWARTDP
jgi:hypothetical protein